MRSPRRSSVPLLVRGLLALSKTVRHRGMSAFWNGRLGAAPTRRLLGIADLVTAWAARIALRGHDEPSSARNTSTTRRDRASPTASATRYRAALLVAMRTVPIGLLAAALWPSVRCLVVMAVVALAGTSAAFRKQLPTADRLTDWDVAVALCFGAVVAERIFS